MENISKNHFQILSWDTAFFGFRVGRILPLRLTLDELEGIVISQQQEGVTLIYWSSDPDDMDSQNAARSCNGFLADKKVTFVTDSKTMFTRSVQGSSEVVVEVFKDLQPTHELENLALQAGVYSRFRVDPRIPENKFVDLYKTWIRKSVSKEIADAVLVVRRGGKVVGMVTVGEKDKRADIGLIAVDASMRGKNLGLCLVRAAQEWALKKGFDTAQVVTQGENISACRFYEKCGYHVDKIENIYHFWR